MTDPDTPPSIDDLEAIPKPPHTGPGCPVCGDGWIQDSAEHGHRVCSGCDAEWRATMVDSWRFFRFTYDGYSEVFDVENEGCVAA